MASLLRYCNSVDFNRLERKVELRRWRQNMGNLDRDANKQDKQEQKADMGLFMKNPMEIFNKENVAELEMKLKQTGNLQRDYIDDIGLNQTIVMAPLNDVEGIKTANASALAYDNQLAPDPSLVSEAKNLDELRAGRKKKMRDMRRLRR